MAQADVRQYEVQAGSSDIFGRVLCGARNHHFIVDGPVQNGCPGEEITPAEIFLAGVAWCGVELVQVLAKSSEIPLKRINVTIRGLGPLQASAPGRLAVLTPSIYTSKYQGINDEQASQLITSFKGR